jgi:hypothetical protein
MLDASVSAMHAPFINRLALVILIFGGALSTSLHGAETNAVPGSLKASIGGFFGTTYRVELRQGTLFCFAATGPQDASPAKATPTVKQWRKFRHSLDSINIR